MCIFLFSHRNRDVIVTGPGNARYSANAYLPPAPVLILCGSTGKGFVFLDWILKSTPSINLR